MTESDEFKFYKTLDKLIGFVDDPSEDLRFLEDYMAKQAGLTADQHTQMAFWFDQFWQTFEVRTREDVKRMAKQIDVPDIKYAPALCMQNAALFHLWLRTYDVIDGGYSPDADVEERGFLGKACFDAITKDI